MFKKLFNKKGYTLVELIIVIGLMGIVSLPLFMSFTTGLSIYESETSSNSDVSDLRSFQLKFNEFIRSKTIGDIKIDSGNLLVDKHIYSLKDGNLIRSNIDDASERVLLTNVESFWLQNITTVEGDVTYFELTIEVRDHDRTFTSNTSYKIRGDF